MNSDSAFGAGIFDDSRPKEELPAAVPPSPPTRSEEDRPDNEEEGEESGQYFQQQERDREKAMLLRRSREETSQEATPDFREGRPQQGERERRKNNFSRWSGPASGSERNRRGGRPGQFGSPMQEGIRRPPQSSETPAAEPSEASPTREAGEFHERRLTTDRRSSGTPVVGAVLLDQRVAILVDVQNMYHSARKIHGRNLSYSKLIQQTVKGRRLIRAIAYLLDRDGVDQGGFLDHLSHCGFEVRRKELIERADGSRKGDWDIGIAADAIALAQKVDVIILVSGDGDFVTLTQMLRQRGVKVEIASFRESTADALLAASEGFHPLGRETLY